MDSLHHQQRRPRVTQRLAIAIFFMVGLLQTLSAFVVFQRADDHEYFLTVAKDGVKAVVESGVEQYDLKAQAAALVFHALASPARWLGAGEIGYLLWLRLLTLAGFLCAFEWMRRVVRPDGATTHVGAARKRFMLVCLLYPGQLAWTASLLRDGPACSLLFVALLAWSLRRRGLAIGCMVSSLALRPEFAIVVAILAIAVHFGPRLALIRHPTLALIAVCGLLSLLLFDPRQAASEFSQLAFSEGGFAYPVIAHPFEFVGYVLVFAQGLVDPMSINALSASPPFALAEAGFFVWLVAGGLRRMSSAGIRALALHVGTFTSMWLFAYFEVFVSGFSRHRLALVILLIALTALARPLGRRRRVVRAAQPIPVDPRCVPRHAIFPAA